MSGTYAKVLSKLRVRDLEWSITPQQPYEQWVQSLLDGKVSDDEFLLGLFKDLLDSSVTADRKISSLNRLGIVLEESSLLVWNYLFDTCLLILLHLLTSPEDSIKAKALKVLGQFFACHANRFCKADLLEKLLNSILPLLLDPQKQVSNAVKEATVKLAQITPWKSFGPILSRRLTKDIKADETASHCMDLFVMLVKRAQNSLAAEEWVDVCQTLIDIFQQHSDSGVRKRSVLLFIEMKEKLSETEYQRLTASLTAAKAKMLKLYSERQVRLAERER